MRPVIMITSTRADAEPAPPLHRCACGCGRVVLGQGYFCIYAKIPRVRTGTTKRSPSADATSPPPHCWANGMKDWASTKQALARVSVSARMWFYCIRLSRLPVRAAISACATGSSPMLQASASKTAQRLVGRSAARAVPSLICLRLRKRTGIH